MMFKNYIKVVFRNIFQQKLFSTINILGLALGFAICMLSVIYITYELSYDTYHEKAENIYRVTRKFDNPSGYHPHFARCPDAWINFLPDEFPEGRRHTGVGRPGKPATSSIVFQEGQIRSRV